MQMWELAVKGMKSLQTVFCMFQKLGRDMENINFYKWNFYKWKLSLRLKTQWLELRTN